MPQHGFGDLLRRPIVVAPMAGGPTTTDLVIAAAGAGALGFLAAGYKTPAAMTAEIKAVRPGFPLPPDSGHMRRRSAVVGYLEEGRRASEGSAVR